MAETNLKDLFKQAADIAKDVPESMQEAAFNRALDFLLGLGSSGAAGKKRVAAPTRRTQGSQESPDDEVDTLLQQLDRTAHPKILDAPRVLDRSLALLRIARDEFSIDGLSAPQIARVLTEKFRFRTSRQAVTQALATAIDKVDRVLEDGEVRYRIMAPGEEYLNKGVQEPHRVTPGRSRRRPKKKAAKEQSNEVQTATKISKRLSGRPGPIKTLTELARTDFFQSPKTIGEIQSHVEEKKGHKYKVTDLSPALVRLLRSGILDREKNTDGQYAYKKH